MSARDDAPPGELLVQTDLDGFRCEIRPFNPSENWLLLFVPAWWVVGLGFWSLALWVDPGLGELQMTEVPAWVLIAWPVGLFGWAPAFMVWRARRSGDTLPLNLDPGRLTVGDRSWAIRDIERVEENSAGLQLTLRDGQDQVPMRSNSHPARQWLAEQIEAALISEVPEVPEALQALRERDPD